MNAVNLAEQATLGSLMLPGQQLTAAVAWLRAEDFAHPWHREVFTVIRELHAAHQPHDGKQVGMVLLDRLGSRKADLPHLVDLLQTVPIRPHPQRYAAMVLEQSSRRTVAMQAVLIEAGALASAQAHQPGPTRRSASVVLATLDDVEHRWRGAVEGVRTPPTAAQRPQPLRLLDRSLGADRLLQSHPPLDRAQVRADEAALVAALVARPTSIPRISTWLRAESLTDPRWRAVYSAACHLAESGQPVDVVTVAWELRRASRRMGHGPDLAELRHAVDDAAGTDHAFLGRRVAADHLRICADRGAGALRASAANPGLDLVDVIGTGRIVAAAVRDAAEALASTDVRSVVTAPVASTRVRAPWTRPSPPLHIAPVAG